MSLFPVPVFIVDPAKPEFGGKKSVRRPQPGESKTRAIQNVNFFNAACAVHPWDLERGRPQLKRTGATWPP